MTDTQELDEKAALFEVLAEMAIALENEVGDRVNLDGMQAALERYRVLIGYTGNPMVTFKYK
jgi:hypothetical protein